MCVRGAFCIDLLWVDPKEPWEKEELQLLPPVLTPQSGQYLNNSLDATPGELWFLSHLGNGRAVVSLSLGQVKSANARRILHGSHNTLQADGKVLFLIFFLFWFKDFRLVGVCPWKSWLIPGNLYRGLGHFQTGGLPCLPLPPGPGIPWKSPI